MRLLWHLIRGHKPRLGYSPSGHEPWRWLSKDAE